MLGIGLAIAVMMKYNSDRILFDLCLIVYTNQFDVCIVEDSLVAGF
jgi:hypothetical protein